MKGTKVITAWDLQRAGVNIFVVLVEHLKSVHVIDFVKLQNDVRTVHRYMRNEKIHNS